jgi:hypothetical protein
MYATQLQETGRVAVTRGEWPAVIAALDAIGAKGINLSLPRTPILPADRDEGLRRIDVEQLRGSLKQRSTPPKDATQEAFNLGVDVTINAVLAALTSDGGTE